MGTERIRPPGRPARADAVVVSELIGLGSVDAHMYQDQVSGSCCEFGSASASSITVNFACRPPCLFLRPVKTGTDPGTTDQDTPHVFPPLPFAAVKPGRGSALRACVARMYTLTLVDVLEIVNDLHCFIAYALGTSDGGPVGFWWADVYALRRTCRRIRSVSYYDVVWIRSWSGICMCRGVRCAWHGNQSGWVCPPIFNYL